MVTLFRVCSPLMFNVAMFSTFIIGDGEQKKEESWRQLVLLRKRTARPLLCWSHFFPSNFSFFDV
jgi:hypothetical protein